MERPKRPYSVHRRPSARKNRHIYYVRFRDPETGAYQSAISSRSSNVNTWPSPRDALAARRQST